MHLRIPEQQTGRLVRTGQWQNNQKESNSYLQIHRNTISFHICKLVEQEVDVQGKWAEPSSSTAAASTVYMSVSVQVSV